jgi:hypothetical protein
MIQEASLNYMINNYIMSIGISQLEPPVLRQAAISETKINWHITE